MENYVVLVESGCDLPKEFQERYNVYVVPMHVTFGDVTKDDGDFPVTELFEYYEKNGKLPQTAGSTPHDFELMYDRIRSEHPGCHIIYLAYSAVTTCTFQSGVIAAEGRDYVSCIDTKHCSAGQTMCVLHMLRYMEEHPDFTIEEIEKEVEHVSKITHMGFFPGDLVYLKAGGRVSNAAYFGALLLSLKPMIEINGGYLEATKKYRGNFKKIGPKFFKEFSSQYHFSKEHLAFIYSEGLDQGFMDSMKKLAEDEGYRDIIWVKTGCVVSTHSGPGAFGVVGYEG